MTQAWIRPADTQADRRAEVCRWYRMALLKVDPSACEVLDNIVRHFGQDGWLITDLPDEEVLISRKEVARRAGVAPATVSTWEHRGWITRYPGGYNWHQVEEMQSARRLARKAKAQRKAELDL